jgi:hypothetical protein
VYTAAFRLSSLDGLPVDQRKGILAQMTSVLAFVNYQWIRKNPSTPRLFQIAPRYDLKARPLSLDFWDDLPTVYRNRAGDCKDFVAIRCAEEWIAGNTQAQPFVTHTVKSDGRKKIDLFHVIMTCGPLYEDPAKELGMPTNVSFARLQSLFT